MEDVGPPLIIACSSALAVHVPAGELEQYTVPCAHGFHGGDGDSILVSGYDTSKPEQHPSRCTICMIESATAAKHPTPPAEPALKGRGAPPACTPSHPLTSIDAQAMRLNMNWSVLRPRVSHPHRFTDTCRQFTLGRARCVRARGEGMTRGRRTLMVAYHRSGKGKPVLGAHSRPIKRVSHI